MNGTSDSYFDSPARPKSFGTRAEVFVAPIDVIVSPHDVVQPDVVAVENQAQVSQRGIEGPPLLVVEVLSPATAIYDRCVKSRHYAVLGVRHYWILDPPARTLECYRNRGRDTTAGGLGDR